MTRRRSFFRIVPSLWGTRFRLFAYFGRRWRYTIFNRRLW
jgi:hypothetical protein